MNPEFNELPNKQNLLTLMARERDELERLLSQISDAQMLVPGADGWSIKDHMAHITAWEAGMVALLQKQPRYAGMGLTREEWTSDLETSQLNQLIYERNKHRSLADVRDAFDQTHRELLDMLNQLTNEDLFRNYAYYQPDEVGDDANRPIINWIVGDSFRHYSEHREWIRKML